MRNTYLNKNAQDASNYIEDILNDPWQQIPAGHYLVTRPIVWSTRKQLDARNVVLYTKDDFGDVLLIRHDRFDIENLEINTSLVLNGNPEHSLMKVQYRGANMQYSRLRNVTLEGGLYSKYGNGNFKELMEFGHTGFSIDPVTKIGNAELREWLGESHWNELDLNLRYLYSGFEMKRQEADGKKNALSRNFITVRGLRCKKLIYMGGGQNHVQYRYNNTHILFQDQADFSLCKIEGEGSKVWTSLADWAKFMTPKEKKGVKIYAHKWKVEFDSHKNYLMDGQWDWGWHSQPESEDKIKTPYR